MILKLCSVCKNSFEVFPSRVHVKYCSKPCRSKGKSKIQTGVKRKPLSKRVKTRCQICGKTFEALQCRLREGKSKYCGKECKTKAHLNRVELICPVCEITFSRVASQTTGNCYCSHSCRNRGRTIVRSESWKQKMRGSNNPMYGRSPGHSFWTEHNTLDGETIWMRSTYEDRFATILESAGIEYEYEPERFVLREGLTYIPDFFIPSLNLRIEVKGWLKDKDVEKLFLFAEEVGAITLIQKEELEEMERANSEDVVGILLGNCVELKIGV